MFDIDLRVECPGRGGVNAQIGRINLLAIIVMNTIGAVNFICIFTIRYESTIMRDEYSIRRKDEKMILNI
jgi:hypothetical protein